MSNLKTGFFIIKNVVDNYLIGTFLKFGEEDEQDEDLEVIQILQHTKGLTSNENLIGKRGFIYRVEEPYYYLRDIFAIYLPYNIQGLRSTNSFVKRIITDQISKRLKQRLKIITNLKPKIDG